MIIILLQSAKALLLVPTTLLEIVYIPWFVRSRWQSRQQSQQQSWRISHNIESHFWTFTSTERLLTESSLYKVRISNYGDSRSLWNDLWCCECLWSCLLPWSWSTRQFTTIFDHCLGRCFLVAAVLLASENLCRGRSFTPCVEVVAGNSLGIC